MAAKAKHRRPKSTPLARRLVAVGTGGAALALPLVAATTAEAAPVAHHAPADSAPATTAAHKDTPETYSVVAGDSLFKIARAHDLSGGWKKLYRDNRQAIGEDPSLIQPGLTLTLGAKAEKSKSTDDSQGTASTTASKSAQSGASTGAVPASAKTYSDNLDGWIKESLDVMAAKGIPGTYDGIYRNIMRESSGNPQAINNYDSNAAAGTPSKGLLQVIAPTFQTYHVAGTSMDIYDPVANITAACNYAAAMYGSIDNVNGPY
ncbi:transglycosylase SLT domain-containing protein [Streptomyces sp. NPDC051322]|uniref:LysM peptidoglycan-binding domain-containing protein n=1 Tax=Streptomyces sp. NPDC051322 TaxID=3154645 RepID=UPI00344D27E2